MSDSLLRDLFEGITNTHPRAVWSRTRQVKLDRLLDEHDFLRGQPKGHWHLGHYACGCPTGLLIQGILEERWLGLRAPHVPNDRSFVDLLMEAS